MWSPRVHKGQPVFLPLFTQYGCIKLHNLVESFIFHKAEANVFIHLCCEDPQSGVYSIIQLCSSCKGKTFTLFNHHIAGTMLCYYSRYYVVQAKKGSK